MALLYNIFSFYIVPMSIGDLDQVSNTTLDTGKLIVSGLILAVLVVAVLFWFFGQKKMAVTIAVGAVAVVIILGILIRPFADILRSFL